MIDDILVFDDNIRIDNAVSNSTVIAYITMNSNNTLINNNLRT